jgi:hypothetical protein
MNRIDPQLLPQWAQESVQGCRECSTYNDGTVWVCGYHENLAAAARVVDNLAADLLDGDR